MATLKVVYFPITNLKLATYNARKWSGTQLEALMESVKRFGTVDPLIVNGAANRKDIVIGGHMRIAALKKLGIGEAPVVYVNIPDEAKEKELNLRLNRNTGEFDFDLLKNFDETFLKDAGFSSEELDEIFAIDVVPEEFDLKKALAKAGVDEVTTKKGDIYESGDFRLMVGDSCIEADMLKLMGEDKADMVLTDPPYRLSYNSGKKRKGKPTEGFGLKRDRKYLETDVIPDDFTEKWMSNVSKIAKPDFSIVCYENWKNVREIWGEMEKYWKVRNMIIWHLPNRVQGFSAKYKLFSKYDPAMVAASDGFKPNMEPEDDELLQNEYETALYATSGKPTWEGYSKGKKYCPTDFVEFIAADEKSSGQGVVFGTKPIEILLPYVKFFTKRGDIVLEPFGGSGSTAVAALKLKRRVRVMEKSNVYAAVILARIEKLTGEKVKKVS